VGIIEASNEIKNFSIIEVENTTVTAAVSTNTSTIIFKLFFFARGVKIMIMVVIAMSDKLIV